LTSSKRWRNIRTVSQRHIFTYRIEYATAPHDRVSGIIA
jgi:hypothetical protein